VATSLIAAFALIALGLAALGVYGVVSYAVGQRRRELGVRLALGAHAGDIRRLVIRQAMVPVLAGVALGLAASFALGRGLSGLLFGVAGHDPAALLGAAALLAAIAFLASLLPARRAASLDPVLAMRDG
jgi:ABC-type antimicrobial peptide transport system permease subunit